MHFVDVHDDLSLDYDSLASQLNERTRVVAFPVAANSVGTAPDVRRIVELAHSVGALAWADAVHFAPHGPIDVTAWDVDVLLCSPYKFYGPHMGIAFGKRDLLDSWRAYKVRPAADEPAGHRYELGTCQHELLAGLVAAIDYIDSIGWDTILPHERALGQRFLDGLPSGIDLYGLPTMEGRVSTFCFNVPGRTLRGGRDAPRRRARHRRLVGQLLRPRDDPAARSRRLARGGPRGIRPLQHRGRSRPPAGGDRRAALSL